MKEPYRKGLAPGPGPESCADNGNMTGEALTFGTRRPSIEPDIRIDTPFC
jgi:hypothetical protein